MLRFLPTSPSLGRREFLRIGGLGLGGLTLGDMLRLQAAGRKGHPVAKDRSVIFLFMHGGPSQIETFDPKMDRGPEIRSATGEVRAAIAGVPFGWTFQKLARLADKLSIVRSFVPGDAIHDIKSIVGEARRSDGLPSSLLTLLGQTEPVRGLV